MQGLTPAITRTIAPMLWGWITAVLLKRFGYAIDEKTSAEMFAALSALIGGGVYIAIRIAASKFPKLELLLGTNEVPIYAKPSVARAYYRTAKYNRERL